MFRFISEDLKLLIEGLELKKWDRHGKLIAGCSDIFKDISYYLKLYDSELDYEIVKKTNLNKIIDKHIYAKKLLKKNISIQPFCISLSHIKAENKKG